MFLRAKHVESFDFQSVVIVTIDICFAGNDYTSAFYGTGKTRAFKAIQRNEDFINLLPYLTDEQIIDDDRDSEEEDMDIDDLENDYFLDE